MKRTTSVPAAALWLPTLLLGACATAPDNPPAPAPRQAAVPLAAQQPAILLATTADGAVLYAGEEIGVDGVAPLVQGLLQEGPRAVVVHADPATAPGLLEQVAAQAELAGPPEVRVSFEPLPSPPPAEPVEAAAAVTDGEGGEAAADATAQTATDAEAGSPSPQIEDPAMGPAELALWNDPGFRRYFTESYIAETEIEPRVTVDERETMQEVLDLIASERMDKARELLARNRGPAASAVFDYTLANILFQQERFEEAESAYRAAVEKHPRFRRAWRFLGVIHVRLGDFSAALPELTRVIELGGGDAVTYGLLGYAYLNVGNSLAAESAYRMAILLDPATVDFQMGLARSFFEQRRYADAVALCDSLIAERPDSADLWLLQANAYIGLGQSMRAAENYELVDRMGRSTVESLHNLGDIYINQELFDLAVDAYLRAMQQGGQTTLERALRAAKALAARGALDETRRLVEGIEASHGEALETDQRKDLLKLRARLAVAAGAGDEEARVLEQIVELDPLDGEALLLLGQHASRGGDEEKAIFYYERAASLEAFEADAKVRHAQVLVGQGRYNEALPLLRRAQTLNPRENVQQYLEQVERVAQSR